ncbi:uncharacterized protein LOC121313098 isoform X3 [Polyodon spathula]|uniref:uncharacterized protein LOC121313098 isoform X3 n=1 Tax=Polyodon spathula TaxID=7913 RepID=UPI001B7F30DA|nr:uncharacterized protein LOC121313098 isoform X3 [Polyodon spathula]
MSRVDRLSGNPDRNHQTRRHRDKRDREARDPHQGGPAASSDRSKPHHYARPVASGPRYPGPPSPAPEDYFEDSRERLPAKPQSKCSYVCSRRGMCLNWTLFMGYVGIVHMAAIGTTLMVLICVAVAQAVMSGFSAMGGLATGSFSLSSDINPFQGTELKEVNATDVCKKRERLYARQGYTWMNCSVQGSDAAVALFGLMTAILYFVGALLCGLTIRLAKAIQRDMYLEQNQPEPEGSSHNGKQRNHSHRRHQRNIDPDFPVSTLV